VLVDETNSEEVVGELVITLSSAQSALKEDMVVKIAILAEKYSPGNLPSSSSCTSYKATLAVIGVLFFPAWQCVLATRTPSNLPPFPCQNPKYCFVKHHLLVPLPLQSCPFHPFSLPALSIHRYIGNKWYVDTMVSVMLVAGDFVAEPVWHRVIMIVTNNLGKWSREE
jgi:hypothetical protein